MTTELDARLNAYRSDLADRRLEGQVDAPRFVEGLPMRVKIPLARLRGKPGFSASTVASPLMGEDVLIFDRADGWAWAQSEMDGYVGYAPLADFGPRGADPTHRVDALRAHIYPEPDLKTRPETWAPLGARLTLLATGARNRFRALEQGGWIYEQHVCEIADVAEDWVAVAERFVGAPYLWGGDAVDGIDCSGLMQTAMEVAGLKCPRDSDMQSALGEAISIDGPVRRGDLMFWKGHVGVMLDAETLLHANAWRMAVAREPLAEARARIEEQGGGPVTAARRLS
ncbi:MAG: NlpC/P60 family protein [Pseudomonadota bacterium]